MKLNRVCKRGHSVTLDNQTKRGECKRCTQIRALQNHSRIRETLIEKRKEASIIKKKWLLENALILTKEKFLKSVFPEPNTGCWLWHGPLDKDGYARFGLKGYGSSRASRHAFRLFKQIDPKELYVLHKCDTPSCVNPDHLWLGTAKDNAMDCVKKGRHSSKIRMANKCKNL